MTALNGLPAHVLLVHFIVVLAPLTALLVIVCSLWPAARHGQGHLVWLTLALAIATTVLTPITTDAGEWLYGLRRSPSPILAEHAERGGTMIYFSATLLIVTIGLVAQHLYERRTDRTMHPAITIAAAVITVAVAISMIVQIYRIGDPGAQSVWGNEITHLEQTSKTP